MFQLLLTIWSRMPGGKSHKIRDRWERERAAQQAGLFEADAPSIVQTAEKNLHLSGTDSMRSSILGAPDSDYYEDQGAAEFNAAYNRLQEKTTKLLRTHR